MSAERDELRRLVQELPEELVPRALVDVWRYVRPGQERQWPPAWFGSIAGDAARGLALGLRNSFVKDFGR